VWSLLCPFRQAGRKPRVGKVGPLLKLDAKTVRKAVYRLRDRGLLNGMTPVIPDPEPRPLPGPGACAALLELPAHLLLAPCGIRRSGNSQP
jgi:hypothetical protein